MQWTAIFSRTLQISLKILAAFLVLFALLVSLIRGLLPQLDDARNELVRFVEDTYHVQVYVGGLSAQWQAYGPAITVDNLVLPEQDKLPATLILQQVQVKLDFWQTLLTLSPKIEDVKVDGVHIGLKLNKIEAEEGKVTEEIIQDTVQELKQNNPPDQLDWLYQLLFEQLHRYSLSDVSIELLSHDRQFEPIHIQNFHWLNRGDRHRGQGELKLDDNHDALEYLALQFDFNGDGYQPETIKGQVYLEANALDLGEWSAKHQSTQNQLAALHLQGVINLQGWVKFENRNWQSGLIRFKPSWLKWNLDDDVQRFEINKGEFSWVNTANGFRLRSDRLDFVSNDKHWHGFSLAADYQDHKLLSQITSINLEWLEPLLPLIPQVSNQMITQWHQLKPQGYIDETQLSYAPNTGLLLSSQLQQVGWKSVNNGLGAAPFDARVSLQDDKLFVSLPEQDYQLDFGEEFVETLHLKGEPIIATMALSDRLLTLPKFRFFNSDIDIQGKASVDLSQKAGLALSANVAIHNVGHAFLYLPQLAMGKDLTDYLTGALVAGNIPKAKVVWQGSFSDFPFTDHSGVFQAGFELADATFRFQPDWPDIDKLWLSALFENDRMDLRVNKGQLIKVPIDGAHVFIPVMDEHAHLGVQAELYPKGEDATEVLQSSPLSDSVGEVLNIVQVQGQVKGVLDLDIPLYEGSQAQIRGQISLKDNPIYISEPGIELQKVKGDVRFQNDTVEGDGLTALLYQQPTRLSFDTEPKADETHLHLTLGSHWDLSKLPVEFENPLSPFYSGDMDLKAKLKMVFSDSGYSLQGTVGSNLVGVTLDLPEMLAKTTKEKKPLQAEIVGDNKQLSMSVKLADQAEFWGSLDPINQDRLKAYDIIIGRLFQPGDVLNSQGGQLRTELQQANLEKWLPVIDAFTLPSEKAPVHLGLSTTPKPHFFPNLVSIQSQIERLDFIGQPFKYVQMNAAPEQGEWVFHASSDNFAGQLTFHKNWDAEGISIDASKLYLFSDQETQNQTKTETSESEHVPSIINSEKNLEVLKGLPVLTISAKDFRFKGLELGHFEFQGKPESQGYKLHHIALTTPKTTVIGSGDWSAPTENTYGATQLNVNIDAQEFDAISKQLGVSPGIKDAPLKVKLTTHWQGAPYDFDLSRLNGDVNFHLGKGHLSEVSDKGARIFSLFSLDSLLRKLSFDFSDVFGKGLYFNSFTGDLRIDDGVVKTTNTEMDAVAGTMRVRGYTDLTKQSLNYDVRFSPKLASSVPTVVLLSTPGWAIGLGAFALTKVLEPVIEVISEIRFRLTGTMSKPNLEEVERKSKEIEIPDAVLRKVNPSAVREKTPKDGPTNPAKQSEVQQELKPQEKPKPAIQNQPKATKPVTNAQELKEG
ncbi:YhdP family protein [Parashewanella curva]|uniref:YhdP family protein n=1 Tax=Parashewanella curva TaxID=2338552 RepID=UPI001404CE86|nr:YhdP family protein [Parashewanella curva]